MKHCPQCNRTYTDETITFCLADGALLSAPYDSHATQRIDPARITNLPPTVVMSQPYAQPVPQPNASSTIYIVIGIMAGLIIALAGIILIPYFSGAQKEKGNTEAARNAGEVSNDSTKAQSQNTSDVTQDAAKPATVTGNTTSPTQFAAPPELLGRWQGQWSSPRGTVFNAELSLEAGTGGGLQGFINWTMKSTPQPEKQSRVGLKAVEYVRGSYDPQTRTLTMAGYKKDDPNGIIILDRYRLNLSVDNRTISGPTWNHGNWRGQFSVSR